MRHSNTTDMTTESDSDLVCRGRPSKSTLILYEHGGRGDGAKIPSHGDSADPELEVDMECPKIDHGDPVNFALAGTLDSTHVGPTPSNTPTILLSNRECSTVHEDGPGAARTSGAVVAPPKTLPQVPLAENYVEEGEGGLVGSAVEILNTARDLLGAIMGTPRHTRQSWYE